MNEFKLTLREDRPATIDEHRALRAQIVELWAEAEKYNGWHQQACLEIERLRQAMQEACDMLAERTYGSPARSPGHNARVRLESALGQSRS